MSEDDPSKADVSLLHFDKGGMRITMRILDYSYHLREEAVVQLFDAHRERHNRLISEIREKVRDET